MMSKHAATSLARMALSTMPACIMQLGTTQGMCMMIMLALSPLQRTPRVLDQPHPYKAVQSK
jgi:hypothetical protein